MADWILLTLIIILSIILGFSIYKLVKIMGRIKLLEEYALEVEKFVDNSEKFRKKLSSYLGNTDKTLKQMKSEESKIKNKLRSLETEIRNKR